MALQRSRTRTHSSTRESLAVCLLASVCAAGAAWLGGAEQMGGWRRTSSRERTARGAPARPPQTRAAPSTRDRGAPSTTPRGWLCERRARVRLCDSVRVCVRVLIGVSPWARACNRRNPPAAVPSPSSPVRPAAASAERRSPRRSRCCSSCAPSPTPACRRKLCRSDRHVCACARVCVRFCVSVSVCARA